MPTIPPPPPSVGARPDKQGKSNKGNKFTVCTKTCCKHMGADVGDAGEGFMHVPEGADVGREVKAQRVLVVQWPKPEGSVEDDEFGGAWT